MAKQGEYLYVKIHSPEGIMFEGECESLSSSNLIGPFDILPSHSNYITHINNKVSIITARERRQIEYPLQMGVIRVKSNVVDLFVIMSVLFKPSDR